MEKIVKTTTFEFATSKGHKAMITVERACCRNKSNRELRKSLITVEIMGVKLEDNWTSNPIDEISPIMYVQVAGKTCAINIPTDVAKKVNIAYNEELFNDK